MRMSDEEHYREMSHKLNGIVNTITKQWAQELKGETVEGVAGEWEFLGRQEPSGIWQWYNEKLGLQVNATPYWEAEEGIPMAVYSDDMGWLDDEADILEAEPASAEDYKQAVAEFLQDYNPENKQVVED